jgi:thiol-disulfide isomerase/thioredoxin
MSKLITCLLTGWSFLATGWLHDLDAAKQQAKTEHKYILLNFSGSDWCGPCILMRMQILDNTAFVRMADSTLVLVNADFPRKKKDQLPPQQQALNNAMADKYNPQGKFPYTLLLNADGKIIKAWDGYPDEKPEAFAAEILQIIAVHK